MKIYNIIICLLCVFIVVSLTSFSFAENTLIDEALKYKKTGDWDNSEKAFLSILKKNNDCAECYFHLGEIEENKLNYEKASFYYKKASSINPLYYARLGYCYQTIIQWEKSINAFKEYLHYFPEEEKIREALGISYRKSGNLKESEIIFRNILTDNPQSITALFNLSIVYSYMAKSENSKAYFEQYKSVSELNNKSETKN